MPFVREKPRPVLQGMIQPRYLPSTAPTPTFFLGPISAQMSPDVAGVAGGVGGRRAPAGPHGAGESQGQLRDSATLPGTHGTSFREENHHFTADLLGVS